MLRFIWKIVLVLWWALLPVRYIAREFVLRTVVGRCRRLLKGLVLGAAVTLVASYAAMVVGTLLEERNVQLPKWAIDIIDQFTDMVDALEQRGTAA